MHVKPYKKHLNDFMHNVKLLNSAGNNDLNMVPSTSSHKRHQSHRRINENSIDADDVDLALSLAFPNDMDKYTDDIWRKTLSSDCDPSIQVWAKQPDVNKTPAIVWPSTSSFNPPKNPFHVEDFWSDMSGMSGSNIFFPTSAPSTSAKRPTSDVKSRRKITGSRPSTSSTVEIEDDFNHMKKRLSLSSLRTSLCRQKAVENLNNGTASTASGIDDDDEFLQVDFLFSLSFIYFHSKT